MLEARKGNATRRPISVGRGKKRYPVTFCGAEDWGNTLAKYGRSANLVICVVDATVLKLYGKQIRAQLGSLGAKTSLCVISGSERSKSFRGLRRLLEQMLGAGAERGSFLVAIGGGVTTDLAGCAAALCLRGIQWASVPTTLLGMIDAAIGGKTGINTSLGKNLIGAFWPPRIVALAPEFTLTQKRRDFSSGLSEALKYHAISRRPSLESIAALLLTFPDVNPAQLRSLIESSARVKAAIVTADERESGKRAYLNFGHTIGHALESAANYRSLAHGRAVAAGMVGALWLSQEFGCAANPGLTKARELARGLARGQKTLISRRDVLKYLESDKKKLAGKLRFVLLDSIGRPRLQVVSDRKQLGRAVDISLSALNGEEA